MKKILYTIFIYMILIINVNAQYRFNYSDTINNANNYHDSVELYNIFFIDKAPLLYNGNISTDSRFINGGLLNTKEYDISIRNNETYLLSGSNYYTMNSSKCVLYSGLNNCDTGSTYENRITEMVKPITKVTGSGSREDPWKFDNIILKILLNPNGGTVNPENVNVTYGGEYGELPIPSKPGYTFQGWYTQLDGGTKIVSSTPVEITSGQTLYAHWKVQKFTIVYNCNFTSGTTQSGNMENDIVNYLDNFKLKSNTCSQFSTGSNGIIYEFNGWSTSANGSKVYADGEIIKIENELENNELTLYANWQKINNLNVNYDGCNNEDWYIKFTSTTTFIPPVDMYVDAFLVAGGKSGAVKTSGSGGETLNIPNLLLKANEEYRIVIGGSDSNTTAFGYTARSGYGGAGGSAGSINSGVQCSSKNGSKGEDGKYAFGSSCIDGVRYGAGGASPSHCDDCSDPNHSVTCSRSGGPGLTGGGDNHKSGLANTGGGGGGGSYGWYGNSNGGSGGSGAVIIRPPKSVIVNGINYGTYSGTYKLLTDSEGNNYIKLISSGKWISYSSLKSDLFIVAGGQTGKFGSVGSGKGDGGNGGETLIVNNVTINGTYEIIIGDSDQNTVAFGQTAVSGNGKKGGSGALSNGSCNSLTVKHATSGLDGVYAFNNPTIDGIIYGSSGGGGSQCDDFCENGHPVRCGNAANGGVNAGNGGSSAGRGVENTGAGGGGNSSGWYGDSYPGHGGSGVVIIKLIK